MKTYYSSLYIVLFTGPEVYLSPAMELDLMTGWGREVTQYPTDCLVSLHKLQQEEDVIIIDEGYVSNNWSVNTSTVAGER